MLLYASHIERTGVEFFRLACERDLGGIVAKRKHAAYGEGWFKIRNQNYSQYEGRHELFRKTKCCDCGENLNDASQGLYWATLPHQRE